MGWATQASAEADALLRDAFTRRYRYPVDFAGFSALARFGAEGTEFGATVVMSGPGASEAVIDGQIGRAHV